MISYGAIWYLQISYILYPKSPDFRHLNPDVADLQSVTFMTIANSSRSPYFTTALNFLKNASSRSAICSMDRDRLL